MASITSMGPDTPMDLSKASPSQPTPSKPRFQRWYLEETTGQPRVVGTERAESSVMVNSNEEWKCSLKQKGEMLEGWYWVTLSVTFDQIQVDNLDSMTFSVLQADENHISYDQVWSSTTVLDNNEIRNIPREKNRRLRLLRQVYIKPMDPTGYVEITISFGTGATGSFEVHYVEIEEGGIQPTDHILYGFGKPQHAIIMENPEERSYIYYFQLSSSGTHVLTLTPSLNPLQLRLEVWDLRTPDKAIPCNSSNGNGQPELHTRPFARACFPLVTEEEHDPPEYYSISISHSGLQVTLVPVEPMVNHPFMLLECMPTAPADQDLKMPWQLKQVPAIKELKEQFGYGLFHMVDPVDASEEDELYLLSNGCEVSVYRTHGKWTKIYTVTFGLEPKFTAAKNVLMSLRGEYFAWTGGNGLVSIWNVKTGKNVSRIPVEDETRRYMVYLSKDGSKAAFSTKGYVYVYDTASCAKIGVYNRGLSACEYNEIALGEDYFMTKDDTVSTTGHPVRINGRSIVRIDDMEVVKSFQVQEDYDVRHPLAPTEDVVFGYTQGSVLYFLRMDNLMAQDEKKCGPECGWNPIKADDYMTAGTWEHISTSGSKFRVSSGSVLTNGSWSVHIRISCPRPDGPKDVVVPLCSLGNWCAGFFLPGAKQLILMAVNNLTVWSLTETGADVAELIESWRYQDDNTDYIEDKIVQKIEESRICDCGRRISLRFRTQYFRGSVDVTDPDTKEHTLTYPHSSVDDLDYSEYFRTYLGMAHLIGLHQYGDDNLKRIICAFLRKLVRPSVSSKVSKNYLIALCESWHQSFYESVEQIIAAILPLDRVSWIPVVKSPKKNNPLNVLLRYAEKQPKAMRVGKLIIEYCVTHAIESKNLAFMSPLFGIMNRLMEMYPKDAQSILDRITFVPVKERSFIIENHRISSPPRIRWRFWKSTKQKLYEIENPIMQLDITPSEADPENDRFTRPTFQASFEALWHYTDEGKEQLEVSEEKEAEAAWWTTLGQMVTVALRPRSQAFVESHDFNLAFFDNPAIAALVTYKWNTIGYSFWLARFVFQSTFYSLVVIAALMQVYFSEPGKLLGLFIAIIVMATMFIWLEIVQALESWVRYRGSFYNFLDMVTFTLPLAAGIDQVVVISRGDPAGNTRLLSFAVLGVFLHMLFELRINKSVCKFVTIIQKAIAEIRVFFVIFALGIIAFTIALMHLLRACPVGECTITDSAEMFPTHFFKAISATYFMMGGRYDPVNDMFNTDDWAFHIMMMLFFFFAAILMLNVLIALINVAFFRGDDEWRLTWIGSRLKHIEAAENLSYHLTGSRRKHDFFPSEIYFTASPQQLEAYEKKYGATWDRDSELLLTSTLRKRSTSPGGGEAVDVIVKEKEQEIRDLKRTLETMAETLADVQRNVREIRDPKS